MDVLKFALTLTMQLVQWSLKLFIMAVKGLVEVIAAGARNRTDSPRQSHHHRHQGFVGRQHRRQRRRREM